jgi:hypothetical protein
MLPGEATVALFEEQARRRQLGQRGQALDDVRPARVDDALAGWLLGLRVIRTRPAHRREWTPKRRATISIGTFPANTSC